VAAPTMTKLIAGLERDGFTRRAAGEDARVWLISATPKAKRIMERGKERRIDLLLTLLQDASQTEWATIASAVSSLERHLT
jgi:DNA-binding MarR family transcriptional regulator